MARPPHPSRLPQVLLPPLRQPFPQPNRNSSNGLAEERPCLSLSFCWAFSIWVQRKRKFQREKPSNPQALCAPLGRQPFPRPLANPALQPRRKPNASPTKCGLQKRKPKRKRPPAPRPSEKKRVSRPKRKPRESPGKKSNPRPPHSKPLDWRPQKMPPIKSSSQPAIQSLLSKNNLLCPSPLERRTIT